MQSSFWLLIFVLSIQIVGVVVAEGDRSRRRKSEHAKLLSYSPGSAGFSINYLDQGQHSFPQSNNYQGFYPQDNSTSSLVQHIGQYADTVNAYDYRHPYIQEDHHIRDRNRDGEFRHPEGNDSLEDGTEHDISFMDEENDAEAEQMTMTLDAPQTPAASSTTVTSPATKQADENPLNFLNLAGTDFQPGRLVNIFFGLIIMVFMIVIHGYILWIVGIAYLPGTRSLTAIKWELDRSAVMDLLESVVDAIEYWKEIDKI